MLLVEQDAATKNRHPTEGTLQAGESEADAVSRRKRGEGAGHACDAPECRGLMSWPAFAAADAQQQ